MKTLFLIILVCYIELETNAHSVSDSYNELAFRLYDKLAKLKNENIIYSPYSISTALSMCLLGARNNTEKQLKTLLNYNKLPIDSINKENQYLINYLSQFKQNNLTLNVANKFYSKSGLKIKDDFSSYLREFFKSEVEIIDFSRTNLAAKIINNWVSNQTNNKINDLINANSIDSNTVLMLVNTLYFKADWIYKFDLTNTYKEKFYLENGFTKDVDMMSSLKMNLKLMINPFSLQAKICEFPYVSGLISMTIILPNDGVKLSEIENKLNIYTIKNVLESQGSNTLVDVYIPKFKIEYQIGLADVLSKMGASNLFDLVKANFKGISDQKPLFISQIQHKAIIEVNEGGTEAAAATAIVITPLSSVIHSKKPILFKCNKPFVFIIHEKRNNTILFMGKYIN